MVERTAAVALVTTVARRWPFSRASRPQQPLQSLRGLPGHHLLPPPPLQAKALAYAERFDAIRSAVRAEEAASALAARGVGAATAETNAALLGAMVVRVVEETVRAQVVVFFTNGSFGGIIGGLVRAVS